MADVRECAPDLDIDPYDDTFIADPYPGYVAMRSAGPVVFMPKYAGPSVRRFDNAVRGLRNLPLARFGRLEPPPAAGAIFHSRHPGRTQNHLKRPFEFQSAV